MEFNCKGAVTLAKFHEILHASAPLMTDAEWDEAEVLGKRLLVMLNEPETSNFVKYVAVFGLLTAGVNEFEKHQVPMGNA